MPIEFRARLDGTETYRYYHVPIVSYYLRSARQYAVLAESEQEQELRLLASISAIVYSAMAIEAFINERAEDELPDSEREDFDQCRKKYKRKKGIPSVPFKFNALVSLKFGVSVPEEIGEGLVRLVERRNTLVHYKRNETAGKLHLPGPRMGENTNGGISILWSLVEEPVDVDPPFIQMIGPESAAESHNASLAAIRFWLQRCGSEDQLAGYEEIPSNHSQQARRP